MNRITFRRGLHPIYLPYYDALCGLLPDNWQPISGVRTFEQQESLYAIGRSTPGTPVTKAGPGLSFHNYGLASDWQWFERGRYSPIDAADSRWSEYIDGCEKVGVRCLNWEKPHNEYPLQVRIQALLETFYEGGMDAVNHLLEGEKNGPH